MVPPADDVLSQNNGWILLTRYSPERLSFALRLSLICAVVALVAEMYKTPEIALTTYVVFFLNKPDRVGSIVLSIAFTIIITVIVGFLLVIASCAWEQWQHSHSPLCFWYLRASLSRLGQLSRS